MKKRLDFTLLGKFYQLTKPYWLSSEKWGAYTLLFLVIFLSLIGTSLIVIVSIFLGEVTTALVNQDVDKFVQGLLVFGIVIVLGVVILSLKSYIQSKLSLYWRKWLTSCFLDQYFERQNYYDLNFNSEIDNPDQRIAEDIKVFTIQAVNFLIIFLDALLQLIAFTGVLWLTSQVLTVFLITYAVVGTVVTTIIFGRVLVKINFEQLKYEADFRFGLTRVRENAEAIAFYQGQTSEYNHVEQRFWQAFNNFNKLIGWQLNLNLFQNGYQYITFLLPAIILAPGILSGELEVGSFVKAGTAFRAILIALTLIVSQFEQLSNFAAGIERLDSLGKLTKRTNQNYSSRPTINFQQDTYLSLQNITLLTPDYQTTLIKDLSLTILPEESLLIMGDSGVGKSSILRAIANLWNSGKGIISTPPQEEILFLPQRPYMTLGSLRQQLLYPKTEMEMTDEQLLEVLAQVNLPLIGEKIYNLDVEKDWSKFLSLGEQQRLAFARLLLIKPRYVILDEATSSLDVNNEKLLYQQLQQHNFTYISVGHRSTLVEYHQKVLELRKDCTWNLQTV